MPKHTAPIVLALLAGALAACSPHIVEVRQGNYLTEEVLGQVEIGMTRQQVRYLLGTPVTATPFRNDRWDYVYSRKRHKAEDEFAYVVVWFEGDAVERLEVRDPPDA